MKTVSGFSKLTKQEKISWIAKQLDAGDQFAFNGISNYWHKDPDMQKLFDEFSENTISNFYVPYGVAPNFVIDDETYTIPFAIEESSVVAACSKSAKFWMDRGGFKTELISTTKKGQVHFTWQGETAKLERFFADVRDELLSCVEGHVVSMKKRGGGIKDIRLRDKTCAMENYFQIDMAFETCDAMGANFINTILEAVGERLVELAAEYPIFSAVEKDIDVVMCILSNYTPDCVVRAYVECPVEELGDFPAGMTADMFAKRFATAVNIARADVNRAVTHNKGIFNGIDALVIATGNDFRAIEACGHAYAAKDGTYRGLSECSVKDGIFTFEMTIPLALGTVGGLTELHPMAKMSLSLLGYPSAPELMRIVACVGLAQNFGALRSLVTTGIQQGHMKMHLLNIMNQLGADETQIELAKQYFTDKTVSYQAARDFLEMQRQQAV